MGGRATEFRYRKQSLETIPGAVRLAEWDMNDRRPSLPSIRSIFGIADNEPLDMSQLRHPSATFVAEPGKNSSNLQHPSDSMFVGYSLQHGYSRSGSSGMRRYVSSQGPGSGGFASDEEMVHFSDHEDAGRSEEKYSPVMGRRTSVPVSLMRSNPTPCTIEELGSVGGGRAPRTQPPRAAFPESSYPPHHHHRHAHRDHSLPRLSLDLTGRERWQGPSSSPERRERRERGGGSAPTFRPPLPPIQISSASSSPSSHHPDEPFDFERPHSALSAGQDHKRSYALMAYQDQSTFGHTSSPVPSPLSRPPMSNRRRSSSLSTPSSWRHAVGQNHPNPWSHGLEHYHWKDPKDLPTPTVDKPFWGHNDRSSTSSRGSEEDRWHDRDNSGDRRTDPGFAGRSFERSKVTRSEHFEMEEEKPGEGSPWTIDIKRRHSSALPSERRRETSGYIHNGDGGRPEERRDRETSDGLEAAEMVPDETVNPQKVTAPLPDEPFHRNEEYGQFERRRFGSGSGVAGEGARPFDWGPPSYFSHARPYPSTDLRSTGQPRGLGENRTKIESGNPKRPFHESYPDHLRPYSGHSSSSTSLHSASASDCGTLDSASSSSNTEYTQSDEGSSSSPDAPGEGRMATGTRRPDETDHPLSNLGQMSISSKSGTAKRRGDDVGRDKSTSEKYTAAYSSISPIPGQHLNRQGRVNHPPEPIPLSFYVRPSQPEFGRPNVELQRTPLSESSIDEDFDDGEDMEDVMPDPRKRMAKGTSSSKSSSATSTETEDKGASTNGRYVCSFCSKRFSRPSSLRIHGYSHTGEKPFKCTTCGRAFSVQSNLRRHDKVHRAQKDVGGGNGNHVSTTPEGLSDRSTTSESPDSVQLVVSPPLGPTSPFRSDDPADPYERSGASRSRTSSLSSLSNHRRRNNRPYPSTSNSRTTPHPGAKSGGAWSDSEEGSRASAGEDELDDYDDEDEGDEHGPGEDGRPP